MEFSWKKPKNEYWKCIKTNQRKLVVTIGLSWISFLKQQIEKGIGNPPGNVKIKGKGWKFTRYWNHRIFKSNQRNPFEILVWIKIGHEIVNENWKPKTKK